MMITLVMVIIASFAGMTANAQSLNEVADAMNVSATDTNAIRRAWSDFSNKIGPTTFDYEVNNGHLSAWRHQGWYVGLNGGANALKLNGSMSVNPNAAGIVGYQFQHWHAEARIGATQFKYLGTKKIGVQTDLGLYYDFMPMLGHKWNVYAGVFGGYQAIKFKYNKTECVDVPVCDGSTEQHEITTPIPYKGNSARVGAEIGVNFRFGHKTNTAGVYARSYWYQYEAGSVKNNATVGEVGIRFTFGLGRKVKYN